MMTRLPLLLLLTLSPLAAPPAAGQQVLTLREAVARALDASPRAEAARLGFESVRWDFRGYRAQFLPALTLRSTLPDLTRSLSEIQQDDGSVRYVERNTLSGSATATVTQPILMTGGDLIFSSGLSRVRNDFIDQTQWRSTPLLVGLTQPIFQFNTLRWQRRLEPLRYEAARRTYRGALEAVAVEATGRFFDVYFAEMDREIAAFNVSINDTIFVLSQGRFEIGTIAENDLLQSELALLNAQSDLSDAEIAYQEALLGLKIYLDLPFDLDLRIAPPTSVPRFDVDPAQAVALARRNRAEFLAFEIESVEAAREVARARRTNSFSADLTALFGLNQRAETFDGVYLDPLNQQQVRVSLDVPIFRWGRGRAQVQSAVAARERIARENELAQKELEQEVYFEALRVDQLAQQVRLAAQADTVGTRRFEVAANRYLIGKIAITDLFDAQREKDAARRGYIQALRQFWTAYFTLRRLTLYDFARDEPILGD